MDSRDSHPPTAAVDSGSELSGPVLVVDDQPDLRRALTRILPVDTIEASNAEEALRVLRTQHVTAVVTDFDLGAGGNGEDVLRAAAEHAPNARRVVASGSSDIPKGALVLADARLEKPVSRDAIVAALRVPA